MTVIVQTPSPVVLGPGAPRRIPARPPEYIDEVFVSKFDYETLFYDAFFDAAGTTAILVAPAFLNLAAGVEQSTFTALPSGQVCTTRCRNMDRHAQVWLDVPIGTERIRVDGELGAYEITPSPNQAALFSDKRVMIAISKNNNLEWIQDWIRYNRDIHGANAVLLYDNSSTDYGIDELTEAIGSIGGIDVACVVKWAFRYGPPGVDGVGHWDSDFCQRGFFEHARWKYLGSARSVLNSDIDELICAADDRGKNAGIFSAAERSLSGMVCFPGVWVYGLEDRAPAADAKHTYDAYEYYLNPDRAEECGNPKGYLNTKWAVVPAKCQRQFQWTPHIIIGWKGLYTSLSTTQKYIYRHYREISKSFKYDRSGRLDYKDGLFIKDDLMMRNFSRVRWDR